GGGEIEVRLLSKGGRPGRDGARGPAPSGLRQRRKRALMDGPKHTGCRPATQKHKDGDGPAPGGAGPSPRRHAMAEKPYDRLEGVIWYDGKLVPWGEATLHVLSHGLHYASSVFEGERAYGGVGR